MKNDVVNAARKHICRTSNSSTKLIDFGSKIQRQKQRHEVLAKYLARFGKWSRRQSENLIRQGRVSVDGSRVDQLSIRIASPSIICVDGKPIV